MKLLPKVVFFNLGRLCQVFLGAAIILVLIFGSVFSRNLYEDELLRIPCKQTSDIPYVECRLHDVGKIGLSITNMGQIGTGLASNCGSLPSCQYPYPSQQSYLFAGAYWVGAVVGRDTLVSVGADGWRAVREFWPDPYPGGVIIDRSTNDPNTPEAVSQQDYIAKFTDTLTDPGYVLPDNFDGRPHIPLNLEITQRSYAWSYSYAEDFVLFDCTFKNIGQNTLDNAYIGLYVDADVKTSGSSEGFADDVSGFLISEPFPFGCGIEDNVNIAWIADNDGKQSSYDICPYYSGSLTSVTGVRVLRAPSDSANFSFNWWVSNGNAAVDWGPRPAGTTEDPFRDFGGFLGTPEGDKNKYYILRHPEIDYHQLFAAVNHTSDGWLAPPANAVDLANGFDARYLLSFGPFNLDPGESLPMVYAYVAGENFHSDCYAFSNLYIAYAPSAFYNQLDFSDLVLNSTWVSFIYDNPGIDTDEDGYSGKYMICDGDTVYYSGDGVPDLSPPNLPKAPELWLEPITGGIRLRWNGLESETVKDRMTGIYDFEGYRVYYKPKNLSFFMFLASYDIEDYWKYVGNDDLSIWKLYDPPFTPDELQMIYGISDPTLYTALLPFYYADSLFYFTAVDWNNSDLTDPDGIHKLYPNQPYPSTLDPNLADPGELTEDGYFKYFEYGYDIKNLNENTEYVAAVTAFDFAMPSLGITALQSNLNDNAQSAFPGNQTDVDDNLDILLPSDFVLYQNSPNPFNASTRISFDVPSKIAASILIHNSLGQLVREIDLGEKTAGSHSVIWDGNDNSGQATASGIYIYTLRAGNFEASKKMVMVR